MACLRPKSKEDEAKGTAYSKTFFGLRLGIEHLSYPASLLIPVDVILYMGAYHRPQTPNPPTPHPTKEETRKKRVGVEKYEK